MIINIVVCDDDQDFLDNIQKELFHLANTLNIAIETYLYTDGNKNTCLLIRNTGLVIFFIIRELLVRRKIFCRKSYEVCS